MKKPLAFLLILLTAATASPPAFAQAYRSQLHFLEEFAVRQYERGDKENARKQFGWILRIEPENAIALQYMQKLSTEPAGTSTPAPEQRGQIITDISNVKNDLTEYEKDARELERLIRDLITENDALYQVLYKRSREVAEMRQKFYGTPYAQAYKEAMKSVPMDRVPQRLHASQDILPEDTAVMTRTEELEINGILKDIAALSEQQKSAVNQGQFDSALQAKRDILIQKTMALAEKRDSLNRLKQKLTDINAGLKQTDSRYVEAIQKIDAYYSRFKEKIAKKNYVEQKMFSELVADYASKLKEIEELKKSVRTQDNALTSFKPDIASTNDRLRNIDEDLKAKDVQIAQFKNLVDEYKKQVNERDATLKQRNEAIRQHETLIERQKDSLLMTNKQLYGVDNEVTGIEQALKDGDAQIAQLKMSLARAKKNLPANPPDPALKEEISRLSANVDQATQNVTAANANLERMKAREQKLLEQTQSLQKENADLRQAALDSAAQVTTQKMAHSNELAESEEKIRTLKNDIKSKDQQITGLSQRIAELSQRVAVMDQDLKSLHPPTEIKKATLPDTDLEKRLRASYEKLTAAETQLARASSETAELKDQLTKRDAQIGTLQALPSGKANADRKLLMDALLLKNQELAEVKEQLAALKQAHDLMVLKDAATPASAPTPAAMAIPVEELPQPPVALKEKDPRIKTLEQDLAAAKEAVKTAETKMRTAEEKYASKEIKQDAIDEVIHDRDTKIETLMTEVQALKDELAAAKASEKEVLAKVDEATSARIIAEKELKANAEESSKLHVTVKDLVSDIKAAKAMVEKKSRDHDATLKELSRLSDILDQKKKELDDLQRRVNGSVKKAPAQPPAEDVKAPDCFKDCVQK